MADDRTVIVETPSRSGGSGWVIAFVLIVALIVGVVFFTQVSSTQTAKDNAIANAAQDVGQAAQNVGNAAQEAARTGVAVLTTIHSNSCEATYRRMVSLCKRAVDMSDATLMDYVTEAYPIVVFCKQLENKQRRMMEIQECEILPDGTRQFRPLFQYIITENRMEDGKFVIEGHHKQVNTISDSLAKRLLENGMPQTVIERLRGKEEQTA